MDRSRFEELYRDIGPPLRAYIARTVDDADLADDLLQDTFVRFLRTAPDHLEQAQVRTYLFRTATRLIHDTWRTGKRRSDLMRSNFSGEQTASFEARSDIGHDLAAVFAKLRPRDRSLLWLAYVEGYTHEEIAGVTGIKPASVRVLLSRARERLAPMLQRGGYAA